MGDIYDDDDVYQYENIVKGLGEIMRGPMIETEARKIKNEGIREAAREIAIRMLKRGKLSIEEIVEYSGLSIAEVEQLKIRLAE